MFLLKLHPLIQDGAVLQRGKPLRLCGEASPGAELQLRLADREASVIADENGRWVAELPAPPEGDAFSLEIVCGDELVRRENLVSGEVWICSGQSNMEWGLRDTSDGDRALECLPDPNLRLFTVPRAVAPHPVSSMDGRWEMAEGDAADRFSAVALHFGLKLRRELDVPVGLIHASWGGSGIESWLTEATLEREQPRLLEELEAARKDWEALTEEPEWYEDAGVEHPEWAAADAVEEDWEPFEAPAMWQSQGHAFNGAVWFRKTVKVPDEWTGRELCLELGKLDDYDICFVNGREVGRTETCEEPYLIPRVYQIPASLVEKPQVVVAVRIFDRIGEGGFAGPAESMRITCPGRTGEVRLDGIWKMRVERELPQRTFGVSQVPSSRFNGMIHPLLPLSAAGVAWYQGETNTAAPEDYAALLRGLVEGWRRAFEDESLNWAVVQLPLFGTRQEPQKLLEWATLRQAQEAVLELPGTAMAVTLDQGDPIDIHPGCKHRVGERLARQALKHFYGQSIPADGPRLIEARRVGEDIGARFRLEEGSRLAGEDEAGGFEVEIEGRWIPAKATVRAPDRVIVEGRSVRAVRYGWLEAERANLRDTNGLPAAPFSVEVVG